MRIQHNIAAMSSYRNLTNNNSMVTKSLEKLSSGYRINRAGDDAAGLAISEKMRAQIKGLETAQKNANDGISLVQTAEGALTEVHSMLNRMVELATQSANGTYQNEVDREQLQKEVAQLNNEIDRISKASNFNGIALLDGTLGGGSASTSTSAGIPTVEGLTATPQTGTKGQAVTDAVADVESGKENSYTFTFQTADGKLIEKTYSMKSDGSNKVVFTAGGSGDVSAAATANTSDVSDALVAELSKDADVKDLFEFSNTGAGLITVKSKSDAPGDVLVSLKEKKNTTVTTNSLTVTEGVASYNQYAPELNKTFTVGGQKFMIADATDAAKADPNVNVVITTSSSVQNADAENLAVLIKQKTGYKPSVTTGAGTLDFKADTSGSSGTASTGGGLTLQIGDTADTFNQLNVSVGNMSSASLGIANVDISSQTGAAAAIKKIKDAINTVSDVRGTLGATQNRLEHTINNLSVQTENITAAESRIRDTDMANEMMAYTKNNILVQAAQAMLAQANQVPQGVLQLLQ